LPKPLKEYVQQVLAEHGRGEKIRQAIARANAVVKGMARSPTWRRKGTRRAMFWEEAVDKLIEFTAGDPGLHLVEHHDTISFIFDDAVLVRIKKASISLYTSNYPTPLADLFDDHTVDLFGYVGLQRVEAVYIPNRFDTDIIWSGVVAHDGATELWQFELVEPVTVPVAALPPPTPTLAEDLAKLKDQVKDAKQKKSDDGKR
jgi:hypothetical protein